MVTTFQKKCFSENFKKFQQTVAKAQELRSKDLELQTLMQYVSNPKATIDF